MSQKTLCVGKISRHVELASASPIIFGQPGPFGLPGTAGQRHKQAAPSVTRDIQGLPRNLTALAPATCGCWDTCRLQVLGTVNTLQQREKQGRNVRHFLVVCPSRMEATVSQLARLSPEALQELLVRVEQERSALQVRLAQVEKGCLSRDQASCDTLLLFVHRSKSQRSQESPRRVFHPRTTLLGSLNSATVKTTRGLQTLPLKTLGTRQACRQDLAAWLGILSTRSSRLPALNIQEAPRLPRLTAATTCVFR